MVILRLPASPSTVTTRPPRRSTSDASSVPSSPLAWAVRSTSARNACGVCTATSVARSGVERHDAVGVDDLDRVGHRHRRHRAVGAGAHGGDHASEQLRSWPAAGRRRARRSRWRRSGTAASPARDRLAPASPRRPPPSAAPVDHVGDGVGRQHHHHAVAGRRRGVARDVDHPPARQRGELLGGAEAPAGAAGHHDRPHRPSPTARVTASPASVSFTPRRVTDEPASTDGRSTLGRAMAIDPRPVDVRAVLANTDFFADAPRDTLDALAAHAETRQLVRGDVLFQEGDAPDALYVVLAGRLAIALANPIDRRESVVALMEAGDLFGELGLLDDRPRSAMARALEPSLVLAVPYGPVVEMFQPAADDAVERHPPARPAAAGDGRGARRLGVPRRHRAHRQAHPRARRRRRPVHAAGHPGGARRDGRGVTASG